MTDAKYVAFLVVNVVVITKHKVKECGEKTTQKVESIAGKCRIHVMQNSFGTRRFYHGTSEKRCFSLLGEQS